MKKIKQIEKEQVMPFLSNGASVYRFHIDNSDLVDLEHSSVASIREWLDDEECLYFTIEEVSKNEQ